MSVDVVVRFVTIEGRQPSSVSKEAYDAIQEIGAQSEWFPASRCDEITAKQKNYLYVFDEFTGRPFEHLRSVGSRIYGPMCVLSCMKNAVGLPKAPHPVFSMVMKDVVASCTSIEKDRREQIHQQIQWMMGTVSKDFHEGVTHLIAGEVGSKKYVVAAELKKHIVSPEWVEYLWKASKNKFVTASDPHILRQHHCPLFAGFVVTVSGIDSEERAYIKQVVEGEGGRYSGEMKINECTHLVVKQPKGQKYEFAVKWKIHIVTPRWLTDSVEAGYCLREFKYSVGDRGNNAPESHSTPAANRLSHVDTSRLSSLSNMSAISVTHVDESAFNLTAATATMNHTSRMSLGVGGDDVSRVQQSIIGSTVAAADVLNDINVTTLLKGANSIGAMEIFDGCKIFISGIVGPNLEKVKKLVNHGGGTRFDDVTEAVTHIIVGSVIQPHMDAANKLAHRPHMVRVDWLVDSTKAGKSMPEEAYYYSSSITTPEAPLTVKKKSKIQRLSSKVDTSITPSQDVTIQAAKEEEDNMAEILSQYMPPPANTTVTGKGDTQVTMSNMTDDSALVRAAEMDEEKPDPDETVGPSTSNIQGNEVSDEEGNVPEDSIFQRKTFLIMGFDKPAEDELKELIEERKGSVLAMSSRGVPDFGIVPILGCPLTRTVNEVVTNAWLQMCVEQGQHLKPASDLLFSPLDINPALRPLEGCIISVSGYTGTERDVLMHLAELAGATVQEYFVRVAKPKQKMKASTHLVVNAPTGGKFTAAKRWKIPAVQKGWLIDSARLGKRQLEEYYFLENATPKPNQDNSRLDTSANTTVNTTVNAAAVNATVNTTASTKPSTSSSSTNETAVTPKPAKRARASTRSLRSAVSETDADSTKSELDISAVDKENDEVFRTEVEKRTDLVKDKGLGEGHVVKVQNLRVKALKSETPKSNPGPTAAAASSPSNVTPGKLFDPNKSFVPQWDFKDAYQYLESPEQMTPKGRNPRKKSLPLDELYAQHLAVAIKNSENTQAPAPANDSTSAQPGHQQHQPQEEQEPAPGPLRGVVIATAKKLIANQSEYNNIAASLGADYRWTYDSSVTHYIFVGRQNDTNKEFRKARTDGKRIISSHWLLMCQEQNCRVDETLFPHTYNPNMSLSISSMKTPVRSTRASTRQTRSTQQDSPETVTLTEPTPTVPKRTKRKVSEEEPEEETTALSDKDETRDETKDETMETDEKSRKGESLVEGLKSLMAATKTSKARSRSLRRNDSFESNIDDSASSKRSIPKSGSPPGEEENSGKKGRLARNNSRHKLPNPSLDTQVEPSQRYEVTWDDPAAREQQEMLAKELAKHSESFSPRHQPHDDTDHEEDRMETHAEIDEELAAAAEQAEQQMKTPPLTRRSSRQQEKTVTPPSAPPIAFPHIQTSGVRSPPRPVELIEEQHDPDETKDVIEHREEAPRVPPVILMSGLKPEERTDYAALIEQLGGQVLDAAHFDTKCTHLVVAAPTRNEKYLASVAAGKWVLHKSFLEASRSQAAFVDEEQHEWGSDATRHVLTKLVSSAAKLAAAARRWRQNMAEKRQSEPTCEGAFEGWRVVLLTDKNKENGFKRLLQAGGATVVATKPPVSNLETVTHAFIEQSKLKYKVDVDVFVNAGIPCVKAEYIAAYLMDDPAPQHTEYYIPEVAAFMHSGDAAAGSRKRHAGSDRPDTPTKKSRH